MVLNKNKSFLLKLQRLVLTCHQLLFSVFAFCIFHYFLTKKDVTMEICLSRLVNVLLFTFTNDFAFKVGVQCIGQGIKQLIDHQSCRMFIDQSVKCFSSTIHLS